jgi:hypothetical protein
MRATHIVCVIKICCLFFGHCAFAQQDSIHYHDNSFESQWGGSNGGDNLQWSVRFTPPYYPAKLTGLRAYFRNGDAGSTFRWIVYENTTGNPVGGVALKYFAPTPTANPSGLGQINVSYGEYVNLTAENIIVNSGDLYAGITQTSGWPGIARDIDPPSPGLADRNWYMTDIFSIISWSLFGANNGNLGITAFFDPVSTEIHSTKSLSEVKIFPNPASELILIDFGSLNGSSQVDMFDMSGRQVLTSFAKNQQGNINKLDVSILDPGLYILSISNGGQVLKRLISLIR